MGDMLQPRVFTIVLWVVGAVVYLREEPLPDRYDTIPQIHTGFWWAAAVTVVLGTVFGWRAVCKYLEDRDKPVREAASVVEDWLTRIPPPDRTSLKPPSELAYLLATKRRRKQWEQTCATVKKELWDYYPAGHVSREAFDTVQSRVRGWAGVVGFLKQLGGSLTWVVLTCGWGVATVTAAVCGPGRYFQHVAAFLIVSVTVTAFFDLVRRHTAVGTDRVVYGKTGWVIAWLLCAGMLAVYGVLLFNKWWGGC